MVNTPNMNLQQPTINVDSGLQWEQAANNNSGVLDQHDHSLGNGVQIQTTGLNINNDLSFKNNSAVNLTSTVFTQVSSLTTLNALFVSTDGNLYFNDGAGDASIKITSGGTVNATTSGISNGSASASFVASTLVVNAASNTPANIQAGSLLIGNNVAASKFLTLAPPASMGANYTLTLPSLPGAANIMTLDTSGNIAAALNVDNSTVAIASNQLIVKSGGITPTQLQVQLPTSGATVGLGLVAISASCGAFTSTNTSYVAVTNLSVTLTVTGNRPVRLELIPSFSGDARAGNTTAQQSFFQFFRGSNTLNELSLGAVSNLQVPVCSICGYDFAPVAGANVYTLRVRAAASGGVMVNNALLIAYEI